MDKAEEFTLRQRLEELTKALKRLVTPERQKEHDEIKDRLDSERKTST